MKLSSDYLREALEKMGDISQNKKAERLGISSSGMSQYMTGKKIMDDFACIMVAKILGIDGMVVIAAAQMEREKNQARKDVWEDLLKKMGALALGGLTAGAMLMGSLSADNASASQRMTNAACSVAATCHLYIMSNLGYPGYGARFVQVNKTQHFPSLEVQTTTVRSKMKRNLPWCEFPCSPDDLIRAVCFRDVTEIAAEIGVDEGC